jgi:hypothetical protein
VEPADYYTGDGGEGWEVQIFDNEDMNLYDELDGEVMSSLWSKEEADRMVAYRIGGANKRRGVIVVHVCSSSIDGILTGWLLSTVLHDYALASPSIILLVAVIFDKIYSLLLVG